MAQAQTSCASAIVGGSGSSKLRLELRDVKLIAVQEHISYPDTFKDLVVDNHASRKLGSRIGQMGKSYAGERVVSASHQRIQDMDNNGVVVQILVQSDDINSTRLVGGLTPMGATIAKDVNNELKTVVDENPTRFKALAELPMHKPEEASHIIRFGQW